ncbi:MAG: hypothetical protein ACRBBU_08765 [Pseudooceanicola sp.]
MQYELRNSDDENIVYLHVVDPPPLDEAQAINDKMSEDLAKNGVRQLVVDYQGLRHSDMDGAAARIVLRRMDRLIREAGHPDDFQLHVAFITDPDSYGYGIARMLIGHGYELPHLDLAQFDTADAAWAWIRTFS